MSKINTSILKAFVFAGLFSLAVGGTSCGGSDTSEAQSQSSTLELGKDYPVIADVTAGVTKDDLDELGELIVANDKEGFALKVQEKTGNGTAFRLAEGTNVRLIDQGWGYVKVRVLEGPYKNQMGFFDTEFIKGFNH